MTILTASANEPRRQLETISVAVFCGAQPGGEPAMTAASRVGELLGRGEHRLVYGGGGSGLMGAVAWSAWEHGAEILGVIPGFLQDRERDIAAPPQTLRVTDSMSQRKAVMLAEADAFVALPGGYGTLDEILDVIALTYLDVHHRPLVLLQGDDEWAGLVGVLEELVARRYAMPLPTELFQVTDDPVKAVELVTKPLLAGR